MSISICLVTHDRLGEELLSIVSSMMDISNINIQTISIPSDIQAPQLGYYADQVKKAVDTCDDGEKLILCDLYGATPYNLIKYFSQQEHTSTITGVNLPMLMSVLQITDKPLNYVTEKAVGSAQKSIIIE